MSDTDDLADAAAGSRTGWMVATAVLAVAAIVLGWLYLGGSGVSTEDVDEYLSENKQEVEERADLVIDLLLNYDADTVSYVADQMLDVTTGNFQSDYQEVVTGGESGGLAEALEQAAASSEGEVLDGPEIAFTSATEATAIARVRQTTSSNQTPEGRSIEYILELKFVDDDDAGWKADRFDILSFRPS